MSNTKALENAKEFIEINITQKLANYNLDRPINANFSDNFLKNDPNLEILKSELNKIGYNISQDSRPNWWIISKI